jgi:hypothetical protein
MSAAPTGASSTAESPAKQAASSAAETAKQAGAQGPAEGQGGEKAETPEDKMKTKAYWQSKFSPARAALAKAEEEQQLAQDELSLLQLQQARELDPNVQQDLAGQIKDRQAELDAKKAAMAKAKKALEALQEEFKASGAPEDWSKTE